MVDMVAYDENSCSDIEDFPVLLVEEATRKLPEVKRNDDCQDLNFVLVQL